jgi:hypothetical protein
MKTTVAAVEAAVTTLVNAVVVKVMTVESTLAVALSTCTRGPTLSMVPLAIAPTLFLSRRVKHLTVKFRRRGDLTKTSVSRPTELQLQHHVLGVRSMLPHTEVRGRFIAELRSTLNRFIDLDHDRDQVSAKKLQR